MMPNGYTELEWCENTPGQFIDTGILHNTAYTIEVKLKPAEAYYFPFGIKYENVRFVGVFNTYYLRTAIPTDGEVDFRNADFAVVKLYGTSADITVNGVTNTIGANNKEPVSDANGYDKYRIFRAAGDGYDITSRFYYVRIQNGGTPVAVFLPCRRESDGMIGMFNMVDRTFHTANDGQTLIGGEAVTTFGNVAKLTVTHGGVTREVNRLQSGGVTLWENLQKGGNADG